MILEWNDIAAVRGYLLNGMTEEQIQAITDYSLQQIENVIEEFEKERANG